MSENNKLVNEDLNMQEPIPAFNPLSPNIHIQILHTDLFTFPLRISWENLIKDQSIIS